MFQEDKRIMHDLREATKTIADRGLIAATAAAAGVSAMTLADWALIVTIVAGVLSAAWQVLRFYDRFRYGFRVED